ncbi:MalY/PatB family protein [Rhizobium leguminosarum]|uniref:MalY/PatB family protein n=1 Tax=Rhizobium leguminosarum TaxID=384 RepID=UPI001F408E9D|nr:aminotransferase class I/II-fold pyridoxal phosphate-dependent enzyme [Rhizobium leguminosarum]UIJ82184.1 aminotransferase class I/II-fold pyridoxal phosphate-dependent enzyme [Rhizobium leguminosarum]
MTKSQANTSSSAPPKVDGLDFGFNVPLDRAELSSAKWEYEIARKGDPTLLCFGTAEMDYRAAPPICAALERVAKAGHFGYPYKRVSYYEAIIGYFNRHFSWSIQKDWIASNVGIYPSMQPIIDELTSPGDEIIYQPPVHHIFPEVITAAGRTAVANPLVKRGTRYEMDFEDLAAKTTARTKILLLCSPHNPVGRVWTREELERLNAFCLERGVIVVADEVYCSLVFEGVEFTPFAGLSQSASLNSITLVSASKSFNVTGLKHSMFVAENPDLRDAYMRGLKRNNLYFGGCIFGQAATEAAFRDCDDWSLAAVRYIQGNFEYLRSFIEKHLPLVTVTTPEATYFAWLDFGRLGLSVDELRSFFEDEAHVVVTLGEPLGAGGKGHARFNLGTTRSLVEEGLHRIAQAYERRTAS